MHCLRAQSQQTTHLEPNCRLTPIDGIPLDDPTLYHQLVGSLVYLAVSDISYVVHIIIQFLCAPHSPHYVVVLCIFRYIKGTLYHGLHFSTHSSLELYTYSDANWARDIPLTTIPPLGVVSSWMTLSSLGLARNKQLSLDLVKKLNIGLMLMTLRNFSGYDGYLKTRGTKAAIWIEEVR